MKLIFHSSTWVHSLLENHHTLPSQVARCFRWSRLQSFWISSRSFHCMQWSNGFFHSRWEKWDLLGGWGHRDMRSLGADVRYGKGSSMAIWWVWGTQFETHQHSFKAIESSHGITTIGCARCSSHVGNGKCGFHCIVQRYELMLYDMAGYIPPCDCARLI
jgi:hypothetical protein